MITVKTGLCFIYVIARRNDEAIANFTERLCMVCDCHAIARNDNSSFF
jgi:hypothetical protein